MSYLDKAKALMHGMGAQSLNKEVDREKSEICEKSLQQLIERAYALAEKINDFCNIHGPNVRELNRLSWAVQDLQDAEAAEDIWLPLQKRCRELAKIYYGLGGLNDTDQREAPRLYEGLQKRA